MLRKFGALLMVVLAVLGLGLAGIAQSDGSAPYPVPANGNDPVPLQECWYEYWIECGPWYYVDVTYECTRTWRCWFFIYKGCYRVTYRERRCDWWRRECCAIDSIDLGCSDWEYLGWYVDTERTHQFLWCYCQGANDSGCW